MKNLLHGETKTPCVYLSFKGKRSLRFSTALSQDKAEKGRYESQIKPFVLLKECSELVFWIQQERLLGLIMFLWLLCWLRSGLNTGRTVRNGSQLYQVSSCWQLPWLFSSVTGDFLCSFYIRWYRGAENCSIDEAFPWTVQVSPLQVSSLQVSVEMNGLGFCMLYKWDRLWCGFGY